jgi:hypothetical protein
MSTQHAALQANQLFIHLKALCKEIGPRPPTSPQERRAADYVKQTLSTIGLKDIQEQCFMSQNSYGWTMLPAVILASMGIPLGWLGGRAGMGVGAALLFIATFTVTQIMLNNPPLFQPLVARWKSQNVIATVPASGQARRRIYLIGHLDSNKQRFQMPPAAPGLMKAYTTLTIGAGVVGGLSLITNLVLQMPAIAWWQWLLEAVILLGLAGLVFDEFQPTIEGANDNATAVSVLLGIAEALQAAPLQNTTTTLLFTGCEESGCVGMEAYLTEFEPSKENTYWIDLEMVGTGNLCYITRHSISYLMGYTPDAEMVGLAELTAQSHADLRVTAKGMLILEECADLRRRGYKAICIAGYDASGFLPNWHRLSDTLENIEADTLERAATYTWELIQTIDGL